MITEIILVIFAILYYLFSIFVFATCIQEESEDTDSIYSILEYLAIVVFISPIIVPIIFGIKIGESIKN